MQNKASGRAVRVLTIAAVLIAVAAGAEASDTWQWSITPYLWAADISEDLILDGDVVGGGDTEFTDLVDKIDSSLQLHFEGLREAGAVYRPGGRSGRLNLLFGVRMLAVDEDYQLTIGGLDPREVSIDESYLDALVGVQYHIPLSDRWLISLRGDASLGDTDYIWTAQGLLGWRFGANRQSALFAGYRYRSLKYTKADVLEVQKTLSGFGLGIKIGF